jgi:hypothetical protein
MDNQHTGLEERLDQAAPAWGPPGVAPAPTFLGAVRRRRTARRARAAGLVTVTVLAVGAGVWLGRGLFAPTRGTPGAQIVGNTVPPRIEVPAHRVRAASPTIAQLARLNRDGSLEDPVLPGNPGSRGAERAMRVLDSRKAGAFDAAFNGV